MRRTWETKGWEEALAWTVAALILAFAVSALGVRFSRADDDLDLPVGKPEPVVVVKKAGGAVATRPAPQAAPAAPARPVTPPTPQPTLYGRTLPIGPGRAVVFVLDVSGSMGWDAGEYSAPDGTVRQGCRLDRAKAELARCLRALPDGCRFNLMAYDCQLKPWALDLQPSARRDEAVTWSQALEPGGATGTGPAVCAALLERAADYVVLLTDGAPNCGAGDEMGDASCLAAHLSQIDSVNQQRTKPGGGANPAQIDVFGIGASGDFKTFCQQVAGRNGGSYTDAR